MCSNSIKALLFKSYCSSLYTCQLWSNYKTATLRRLNVAFHCTFKQMLNVSRYQSNSMTFVNNGVDTCQEVIRKCIHSFSCRIWNSDNVFISCIVQSDHFKLSRLFLKWQNLLFCDWFFCLYVTFCVCFSIFFLVFLFCTNNGALTNTI